MIKVILCSRNGEKFIREQTESILKQTEREFRLLISDDASTDATAEIEKDLADENPDKILLVRQPSPSGSACAHFLKVLSLYGKDDGYVMFSDQDDVWDPDKIEKTFSVMREAEKKYGAGTPLLVHCDSRITDEERNVISPSFVRYQKMSPERNKLNQILVQNNVTGASCMINRSLICLVTERPLPEHAVMHDQYLALAAAAFGHIVFTDQALYDYRQHKDNDLGAAKGSVLREITDRLGIFRKDGKTRKDMNRHSQNTYQALFRQAAEFYRLYKDKLTPQQKHMLHAFVKMKDENRFRKILTIFRYGFTFNRLHRTIGECAFI